MDILCEEEPTTSAIDRYILRYPRGRMIEDDQEDFTDTTNNRPRTEVNTTNRSTCTCRKTLKNAGVLKIHMAKMGCRPNQRPAQRTGQPGETEEEVVQD